MRSVLLRDQILVTVSMRLKYSFNISKILQIGNNKNSEISRTLAVKELTSLFISF